MYSGRRLVIKRLVRPIFVVESKVRSQPNYQFADRGVTLEINVFMLDVAPEAFDKDIIKGTTFADWEIAQGGTAIAAD